MIRKFRKSLNEDVKSKKAVQKITGNVVSMPFGRKKIVGLGFVIYISSRKGMQQTRYPS